MLKTYLMTICAYYNDSSVYYYGCDTICDESEAIDTETIYSGYEEILSHIKDIPCTITHALNKKSEIKYLELWIQDTCKEYRIDKTSDATVKVVVEYKENKPRLKDLMDLKADLVFRYMAQFLNNGKELIE